MTTRGKSYAGMKEFTVKNLCGEQASGESPLHQLNQKQNYYSTFGHH